MTDEGGHNDGGDTRRYVDHTYQDFSRYIQQGGEIPKHKKSGSNFPARLHHMLEDPNNAHIIAWMPHGRAWKILDKELFMSTLVPTYFGQTKFPSFLRQLNGWGFKRLHQIGPDYGCYYHQCFLRGIPMLTELMRRVTPNQKDKGIIRFPNASGEPDFSLISRQYPLPPPIPMSSEAASLPLSQMLPSQIASQSTAMVESSNSMTTPAHKWSQCGSAQNQTTLVKSAQAQACSTAAMVTSAPMQHLPADIQSTRDHVAAAAHAGDSSSANTTNSPAAAMKSHLPLNYEPFNQISNVWGEPADVSAPIDSNYSSSSSVVMMPFGAPMSYQHLYQMQNITQSAYHPFPPPAQSNLSNSTTHPVRNIPVANSSRSVVSGSNRSGGGGGSPGIEHTLEQMQAVQQAGYPPRSDGYALEPYALTYNDPPHGGSVHHFATLSDYNQHQGTASTSAEQQTQHGSNLEPLGYEQKCTSNDDIDESYEYDDDFISFLTGMSL